MASGCNGVDEVFFLRGNSGVGCLVYETVVCKRAFYCCYIFFFVGIADGSFPGLAKYFYGGGYYLVVSVQGRCGGTLGTNVFDVVFDYCFCAATLFIATAKHQNYWQYKYRYFLYVVVF